MIQDIAPHKLDNTYRPDAVPKDRDLAFVVRGRELAVRFTDEGVGIPLISDFYREQVPEYRYLFSLDNKSCFLLLWKMPLPEGINFVPIRSLRKEQLTSKELLFAAFTAVQLASWYQDNRYCGTCGTCTEIDTVERSILCPACGRAIYPRVVPAVIVGVINGDYLLHTKYERSRGLSFYALVAGFTEIGETLEETVAREVMEETGLKVKHIRYYKSQPWGIADDILSGFYCDVDGDTRIRLDQNELSEGIWIHRKDITGQPDDASLTNHMMITFRDGLEPKWNGPID